MYLLAILSLKFFLHNFSPFANSGLLVGSVLFLAVPFVIVYASGPTNEKDAFTFGMDIAQSPFDVSRSWNGALYGHLLLGEFFTMCTKPHYTN